MRQGASDGLSVAGEAVGLSRRSLLGRGALAIGAMSAACGMGETRAWAIGEGVDRGESPGVHARSSNNSKASSHLEVIRVPDMVTVYGGFEKTLPTGRIALERKGERWSGGQAVVESRVEGDALVLTLAASIPVSVVQVRWRLNTVAGLRAMGDAWERSYGDLGWRDVIPERVMAWYFATHDGAVCHGYGVKTDARALCFWQLDAEGVSLWLNVTNGGDGVELGARRLTMATVVDRRGRAGESPVDAVRGLCQRMCARASRPMQAVYGANDWCYSYGRSTAESILRDTDFTVELSPSGNVRPFSVIDGGWSNGSAAWPDMGRLAAGIRQRTARPGIWIRPLEAPKGAEREMLLADARFGDRTGRASERAYDPTIPEAREKIRDKLREASAWGYEMVKHDFTTYDLLGQWGFEMGPQPSLPGWRMHDRSRTNAEVIADLYALIREAAGEGMLLDGCNTVGHLGQGIFDLQRTGDDTSGHQWERTRRMGVNTLGFRLPQNGSFFILDADVVGITEAVPWAFNRQWMDVLARSGAATMVSAGPPARGQEQRSALREAFAIAAAGGQGAEPLDWMETSTPERWSAGRGGIETKERRYRWSGAEGASAFLSP